MTADTSSESKSDGERTGRFGTFAGVFTPSVLTILGVIMFMRAGFVVGDLGIWQALVILAIAKLITTLTTVSLSAIATNTEVGTGGNYFMISRTLGAEIGGTVGLTLFISQAVAIAFYVIGFSEALFGLIRAASPDMAVTIAAYNIEQLTSSGIVIALFALTFKGAGVAMRAQYAILVVLLASVASFLIGGALAFDSANFSANSSPIESSVGFWVVFAIFFPAATGIDAGANMSGDLADPAKSIPRGTFMAIGFTVLVYLALLLLLAGATSATELVTDPFGALQRMSIFGPLVVAGVFAATLSSALSSFLGAPRILQAMGKDRLLSPLVYFAKGHGEDNEPRRATVLSLFIALAIVWAGGLNAIAEIISMFFLISYGMINLSAFVEGRAGNPSFRPRFRLFGWPTALVGAIGCTIAMIKINETYAILSMMLAGIIFIFLRGRTKADFRDAKRGYTFAVTRSNLFSLAETEVDIKNWRPIVCAITGSAETDREMVTIAGAIESGRGLLTVVEFSIKPELDIAGRAAFRRGQQVRVQGVLDLAGIEGFADAVVARSEDGLEPVLQAHSLGCLKPNIFMFALPPPNRAERRQLSFAMGQAAIQMKTSIVLYKGGRREASSKRIDVWWHGEKNGSLMALIAYLISSNTSWRGARIRLCRVVGTPDEQREAHETLAKLMEAARMPVDVEVQLSNRDASEVIIESSAAAGLVVLGLRAEDVGDLEDFLERRDSFLAKLPPSLLVFSNGETDLLA